MVEDLDYGLAALKMDSDADGGIAAEVSARHGRSAQPESQQVMAVLRAVLDVLEGENMTPTPTTMFAAVMSAMEKPETQNSAQAAMAMCTVLAHILGRVPNSVLRAKFVGCTQVLSSIVERYRDQAATAKAALLCLGQVLAAMDPGNWPAATRPYALLLSFLTDARPKVRKRAHYSMVDVLAALQRTAALAPASDAIVKLSERTLPLPEAAARAAAAASNKQRSAAEDAITRAVSDVLHLLGALKQLMPLMSGASLSPQLDLLFKLYPLRQPLLSRHTTEAITALATAPSSHMNASQLSQLLALVLDNESLWDRKDADAVLSLTRLLQGGLQRLAGLDAALCAPRLPRAFHALVPQLAAEQDGVRFGTSQALHSLVRECITDEMVAAALRGPPAQGSQQQQLPPLQSVVAAVASSLGARYQEAWSLALPVVGSLFERLGTQGAALAAPLLQSLGELCAGAFDAGEEEGAEQQGPASSSYAPAAEAALGSALRCLGPEAVLAALPLNLREGIEGTAEARTWMLPLLRRHVRGAHLSYWHSTLLPLARALGHRSATATAASQPGLALTCHTLELQIWHTLPSFCSWPRDGAAAYEAGVKDWAAAFSSREDLHGPICAALVRLCLQPRDLLLAAGPQGGDDGGAGLMAHDAAAVAGDDGSDDDDYGADDDDFEEQFNGTGPGAQRRPNAVQAAAAGGGSDGAPNWYDADVARAQLVAVRQYARNWLPLLFKVFLAAAAPLPAPPPIAGAIAAYASVTDAAVLAGFFRAAISKLLKVMADSTQELPPRDAIEEGGSTPVERQCSFLELALCLVGGLDDSALSTLYTASKPLLLAKEPALQKKGYKVLAYITGRRSAFTRAHLQDILEQLMAASDASLSAAKRFRLGCLKPIILLLSTSDCPPLTLVDETGRELIPGGAALGPDATPAQRQAAIASLLVAQLVLCTKEANMRTRAAAYELLVGLARSLERNTGTAGVHSLFHIVLAGLVGSTPHMVSASVMALARLVYEFGGALEGLAGELLPTVLMLLRTKSREVVKAVLGFVKVCAMRLPVEALEPQLGPMLEGCLLWADDSKNKFRLKVRHIVERLARRCGYDAVAAAIPASEVKLLTHIRKQHSRKERIHSASRAGSQAGDEEGVPEDARSRRSAATSMARTARASEWAHSRIFSDDEEDAGADGANADGRRSVHGAGARTAGRASTSGRGGGGAGRGPGRLSDSRDEPMDLLDAGASRALVKSAAGASGAGRQGSAAEEAGFERDFEGRFVIRDEEADAEAKRQRKRRRGADDYNSDDSDFEDLRGIAGLDVAMRDAAKSVRFAAPSAAGSRGRAASVGGRSRGGRSNASGTSRGGSVAGSRRGPAAQHSGDRYKPKQASTGGDVKSSAKLEPYAYWQFDRKMLNRRRGKQAEAAKGLGSMVRGAQAGAAKGAKAKRANTKRARTSS